MKIEDCEIKLIISAGDFEQAMKRKPKNQDEFNEWASYVEDDWVGDEVAWQMLFEPASYTMSEGD